jgi:hypothetical protein
MIATLTVLPLLLAFKATRPKEGEHVMVAE